MKKNKGSKITHAGNKIRNQRFQSCRDAGHNAAKSEATQNRVAAAAAAAVAAATSVLIGVWKH